MVSLTLKVILYVAENDSKYRDVAPLSCIIIKITISSIVIGLKKLLFSTNSLAKLLSDNLLSDSSISQSHSKL